MSSPGFFGSFKRDSFTALSCTPYDAYSHSDAQPSERWQEIIFATLLEVEHLYNCRSMNTDPEFRKLAQEAQAGDRRAFEAIYDHFATRIYNFLYRLLGSREEAEDLLQQTFLIALKQMNSLRDPAQLESWIYRIARNEAYQKFRRKKADSLEEEILENEDAREPRESRMHANPEQAFLNAELGQRLQAVLDGLPVKLREVFILAVVQEMSYKDISAVVGRSLLSVKTDIYRARLTAREELKRYVGSLPGATAES
jgi:RNA polymerase sigma-70 factor (ECF subfamily)